jgi:predicted RNA binding protein YcfA (HicA-like mRNA interferase family)
VPQAGNRRQFRGTHPQDGDDSGGRVTVPVHAGEILEPKTLGTILERVGIELGEFVKVPKVEMR